MTVDHLDNPEGRGKVRKQRILAGSILALLVLVVAALVMVIDPPVPLDDDLCPKNKAPVRRTIVLLDTSDPLSPKHRAELERLARDITTPEDESERGFYVSPGEALIVYELAQDPASAQPEFRVCNPGDHPDEWTARDDLTRGRILALRNWRRFEQTLTGMIPENDGEEMPTSPILENLAVIVPRHVPSRRNLPKGVEYPTHLIVFSDLLQNSKRLNHYGPYPEAGKAVEAGKLKTLGTDLTRVRVSLFRLERERYAKWQTRDHYDWWTELVQALNGHVHWQESL